MFWSLFPFGQPIDCKPCESPSQRTRRKCMAVQFPLVVESIWGNKAPHNAGFSGEYLFYEPQQRVSVLKIIKQSFAIWNHVDSLPVRLFEIFFFFFSRFSQSPLAIWNKVVAVVWTLFFLTVAQCHPIERGRCRRHCRCHCFTLVIIFIVIMLLVSFDLKLHVLVLLCFNVCSPKGRRKSSNAADELDANASFVDRMKKRVG